MPLKSFFLESDRAVSASLINPPSTEIPWFHSHFGLHKMGAFLPPSSGDRASPCYDFRHGFFIGNYDFSQKPRKSMTRLLYPHRRIIVNQTKTPRILLLFYCLPRQARNKKGKLSIAHSILFAGSGGHRPIRCRIDPVLDCFGRSGGQRSGGTKRQQYPDVDRYDRVVSPATSHENSTAYYYYSKLFPSNECT